MVTGVRILCAQVLALTASGCGSGRDEDVLAATDAFYAAVAARDGVTACGLLAPGTRSELESSSGNPCEEAVLEEVPASRSTPRVRLAGDAAQARSGDDVAFLALVEGGWRVTAAGCSAPGDDRPYDCAVSGG